MLPARRPWLPHSPQPSEFFCSEMPSTECWRQCVGSSSGLVQQAPHTHGVAASWGVSTDRVPSPVCSHESCRCVQCRRRRLSAWGRGVACRPACETQADLRQGHRPATPQECSRLRPWPPGARPIAAAAPPAKWRCEAHLPLPSGCTSVRSTGQLTHKQPEFDPALRCERRAQRRILHLLHTTQDSGGTPPSIAGLPCCSAVRPQALLQRSGRRAAPVALQTTTLPHTRHLCDVQLVWGHYSCHLGRERADPWRHRTSPQASPACD
mmetsp:Transcript_110294/g.307323  ORF Transcript_110294/g.307323 Transcript_110294/m.307323 type:complete len:266 (-) Transcript_110294:73-870(-)